MATALAEPPVEQAVKQPVPVPVPVPDAPTAPAFNLGDDFLITASVPIEFPILGGNFLGCRVDEITATPAATGETELEVTLNSVDNNVNYSVWATDSGIYMKKSGWLTYGTEAQAYLPCHDTVDVTSNYLTCKSITNFKLKLLYYKNQYKVIGGTACTSYDVANWQTTAASSGSTYPWYIDSKPPTKEQILRDKLRQNLTPTILTKNRQLWGIQLTEDEVRARTLLYDMIGETAFRRYLRRGFIMIEGKNGTLYKVSGGSNKIISYVKNSNGRYEPFEGFCVQFDSYNLPFTDGVVMRKLLVETDEFALRKVANVFKISEEKGFGNYAQPVLARAAG